MICEIQGIPVYYEEYGKGKPVLFIHGWSVDHRLMSGSFEPVFEKSGNYRRIYLDLPGMGQTPSAYWIKNSDNTLTILLEFINKIIGDNNFLLAGESYGAYLTLGLVHEIESRIDGVLLLCPLVDSIETINKQGKLPQKTIIRKANMPESEEQNPDFQAFLNMAIIATPEIFEKYKKIFNQGLMFTIKTFFQIIIRGNTIPNMRKNYGH